MPGVIILAMRKESARLWEQSQEDLDTAYFTTSYSDAANAVPAKLYDAASAEMHLALSRDIIRWVKEQLRLGM